MAEPIKCFLVEPATEEWAEPNCFRLPSGEVVRAHHLPPGAIWDATWLRGAMSVNGDGPAWGIKLPNGHEWMPGSQSGNCPRKGEDHDCWCVHGEAPRLTADKNPEPGRTTCVAGAGSIGSGQGDRYWHGFLRDGYLVEA